ncbi:cytochrome P450 [Streptomyces sp. NPDC001719]
MKVQKAIRTHIPQAPGALPIVGHALPLVRRPLKFMTSLANCGDIVEVRAGWLSMYALTHPDLAHQVLVTQARDYRRGRAFDKVAKVVGDGLGSSSGDLHLRQRRMLQPAFRPEQIVQYTALMRDTALDTVASWQPGQTVAADRVMNSLTLTATLKCLFGPSLDASVEATLQHAISVIMHGVMARTVLPEWWAKLPTPGNYRYRQAISSLDTAVDEAISTNRRSTAERKDVLSILLATRDERGRELSVQQIRTHMLPFVIAGLETFGAALGWLCHELGQHPEIDQRLHLELDKVLEGRLPAFEDLPRLEYTGRIITETLRLHSPWLLMRQSLRPVRLGDTQLPAGTEIIYSPYLLHRDPRWFPDPNRFDPDRWLPDPTTEIPKGVFIPFGAGAHRCIGESFAVAGMAAAAAVIFSTWRLHPLPGVQVHEVTRADVHPDQLPMIAKLRRPSEPSDQRRHGAQRKGNEHSDKT